MKLIKPLDIRTTTWIIIFDYRDTGWGLMKNKQVLHPAKVSWKEWFGY